MYRPRQRARKLTNEQLWILMHMPPEVSDQDAATAIDASASTIHHARWQLQQRGPCCPVRFRVCRYCGEVFTARTNNAKATYHPECREVARRLINQRLDAARPITLEKLDRVHQRTLDQQAETRPRATNHGQRWTKEDDAVVLALIDRPIVESCEALGRSLYSVMRRRRVVRRWIAAPITTPTQNR